jgi:hypothetical protein
MPVAMPVRKVQLEVLSEEDECETKKLTASKKKDNDMLFGPT